MAHACVGRLQVMITKNCPVECQMMECERAVGVGELAFMRRGMGGGGGFLIGRSTLYCGRLTWSDINRDYA